MCNVIIGVSVGKVSCLHSLLPSTFRPKCTIKKTRRSEKAMAMPPASSPNHSYGYALLSKKKRAICFHFEKPYNSAKGWIWLYLVIKPRKSRGGRKGMPGQVLLTLGAHAQAQKAS